MANDLSLNKEQILDAAEQALKRYGPDKTSVVDVARALQVSHGTLYRHFASKAALREAVTERWLRRSIAEPLAQATGLPQGGSAAERLRLWLDTLIAAKRAHAAEDPELFAMYAAVTMEAAEMIDAHIDGLILQMASIIEDGITAGELRPGRPETIARAIFIATSRFHHPAHAREWNAERTDRDYDSVWELILAGLALPTA
ncbi:TetR family transcriptional regulator [Paenibacillus glycinis]|uniref:TetR family transcriptional regulator n=1 Tax=Paenibacillus glycinis TaxID=2697035 RepID=A0ABW9XS50_9BACL|nr:TetR family transcriptional regulator [Paenibacillus glycinis]NBD25492.1 TetR family transcriptional regulator [Paenibacillus glycinis]